VVGPTAITGFIPDRFAAGASARGRTVDSRPGFTLAEVVVAVTVLEVGMVGCLGMLQVANRTLARAEALEWSTQQAVWISAGAGSSLPGSGQEELRQGRVEWRTDVEAGVPTLEIRVTPTGDSVPRVFRSSTLR